MRVSPITAPIRLALASGWASREATAERLTDVEGAGLDGDAGRREADRVGDDRPGSGTKHFVEKGEDTQRTIDS